MAKKRQRNEFIAQGSILALASILVRLIGLIYRVPMTAIIGDAGNGFYSYAYSIYTILLLFSSYSLPLAVSKMVSARVALNQWRNVERILTSALIFALLVGTAFSLFVFFGAEMLTRVIFNKELASIALKFMAPTIFIMALLGVFRGFFQGLKTTIPSAVSQVAEQIINAVVSITAAYFLFSYGAGLNSANNTTEYDAAWGAAGGTIGTGAGALVALLFCLLVFSAYRKTLKKNARRDKTGSIESYDSIFRMLLSIAIPVILSTAVYNLIDLVDASLFSHFMEGQKWESAKVTAVWGAYSGKYLLLVHVPVAISSAMGSSLVPALAEAFTKKNRGQIISRVDATLRFTNVVAFPSAVGLTVLAAPIIRVLFRNDVSDAGNYLTLGAIAVVFFSISTITNSILQGIDRMKVPVQHSMISLVIHVFVLWGLTGVLKMDIYGVLISYIAFGVCMCAMNLFSIGKYLNYRQDIKRNYILPAICSVIMGVFCLLTYHGIYAVLKGLHSGTANMVAVLAAIIVAVCVYFILLILTNCMDEVDLYDLPKGGSLVRLAKKIGVLR